MLVGLLHVQDKTVLLHVQPTLYEIRIWQYQTSFPFNCLPGMATILITGGTGMIGTALSDEAVKRGHRLVILTRDPSKKESTEKIRYAAWNVEKGTIDVNAVKDADAIIHLAGANVAEGRWTEKRKKEIVDSRVKSGALLVKTLEENENKVQVVVSASAIGYYGEDPVVPNPTPFTEIDAPAVDFLGKTCQKWEASIAPVMNLQKRLVILRTGIVMSKEGGAYEAFRRPQTIGVAAILGNGKQVVSWIHIDDLVNMYLEAVEKTNLNSIYNAVAPLPVSNKEIVMAMAEKKRIAVPFKVPSFLLKSMLGEMSTEILKSATVSSSKIEKSGFQFQFPDIQSAVAQLAE